MSTQTETTSNAYYDYSGLFGKLYAWSYDVSTWLCGYARVPKRLAQEFLKAADANGQKLRVIDFGCGTGQLTAQLIKQASNLEVIGVDPNKEMLQRYRDKFKGTEGVSATFGGYDNGLDIPEGEYDAILAAGVFDHLRIDTKMMQDFLAAVKPGGLIGFSHERHDGPEAHKQTNGVGRSFHSYRDQDVIAALKDAGAEIVQQGTHLNYFVNGGGLKPLKIECSLVVARKPF